MLRKHYYGVRSSVSNPKNDLGFKYFSSSTNKEFIKDQKLNPQNYRYKIIKIFKTFETASKFEITLLKRVNAHTNPHFYNKAIYCNSALNCDNVGKIVVFDKFQKKYIQIPTTEYYKNKELYHIRWMESRITALDISKNIYVTVTKKEFENNNNLKGINYGKVSGPMNPNAKRLYVHDNNNKLQFVLYGNSREMSKKYNLPYHNLKVSARKFGEPIGMSKQTRIELRKKNKQMYIGWYGLYCGCERSNFEIDFDIDVEQTNGLLKDLPKERKGSAKGKRNRSAKKIGIFNADHKLLFIAHGTFKQVCAANKLPTSALSASYRNNGAKIYLNSESNIKRLQERGYYKFKGWYAKIMNS